MMFKKILWPTDFSKSSFKALDAAVELAEQFKAELHVVNVVNEIPLVYGTAAAGGIEIPTYQKQLEEENQAELDKLVKANIGKKVRTRTHLKTGREIDRIVETADENDVDLIVIATHGHTGLKRMFIGSVAEGVVRRASQAVLTIRITEEDEAG